MLVTLYMLLCAAVVQEPLLPARLATNPATTKLYRRAEFWDSESASKLEVVNVLGRWERASEWSVRTTFTEADPSKNSAAQGGTLKRYEMAQRTGTVERVALRQNAAVLPFRDDRLATSLGLTVADFAGLPVSDAAVNIVYDAMAESKAGLLPPEVCESRRGSWLDSSGGLDEAAFRSSLYKARATVIASWFVFGKGNIIGLLVFLKVLTDNLGSGSEVFDWLLGHQGELLVVVASAGVMSAVGRDQAGP